MTTVYLAIAAGAAALGFALVLTLRILREEQGNETVRFIGRAIQEGAMAFLTREYRMLAIFVLLVFAILVVFIDYDVLAGSRMSPTSRRPPLHTLRARSARHSPGS